MSSVPRKAPSARSSFNAATEANTGNYTHLYVVGFAIQPNAREMIESADAALGIPATYMRRRPTSWWAKVIDQRGNELMVVKTIGEAVGK